MTNQQSKSQRLRNSRQGLVALGTVVLFAALLEQAAMLVRHLLSCLAGQVVQALPWVFLHACHSLQATLPDVGHLLTCYNLVASAAPVFSCALGIA
jgi:hypothetical protein